MNWKKIKHQLFFLEKILWHLECSFANPAWENSAENEAESIRIQKGQIKFAHFSQKKRENVAWTRKNIFDNCDKVFRHAFKSFFHSKSKNGRTILILWRKEISSNRSSGYVECRIDKTDKIVFVDCSKLHRSKSVNEKIWYWSKKEHYFFRKFLWTLALQFSLSWRKDAAKLSNKICSRSEFEKKPKFSKKQFFPGIMLHWTIEMQFWTSCKNVSTKYLEEISALTGRRHDFLKRNVFSLKNFVWKRRKMFANSGQNFSLAFRKKIL